MEDSGWKPEDIAGQDRSGVMMGSGIGGLQTIVETSELLNARGPRRVSPFFIPSVLSCLPVRKTYSLPSLLKRHRFWRAPMGGSGRENRGLSHGPTGLPAVARRIFHVELFLLLNFMHATRQSE